VFWTLLGLLCVASCNRDEPAKEAASTASAPPATATGPTARQVDITLSFIEPRFQPDPIVLQVGKPVQFKITSSDTRHTFIIEALGIDVEVPQKSLDESITTPVVTPQQVGTFRVYCRMHGRLPMQGTVIVEAVGQ
jgi:heme/copper-type cytochrome/quinol oxidase subunit 2